MEPHLGLILSSGLRFHGFPYRSHSGPLCPSCGEEGKAGLRKRSCGLPPPGLSSCFFRNTSLQFSVFFNKLPNCLYSYFAEDKHLEVSDSNQDCCYFSSLFGGHRCHFQLIFSFVGKAGSKTVISGFSLPVNPLPGPP